MTPWAGDGVIRIRAAWCKGCGICVAVCPRASLKLDDRGRVQIADEASCTGCRVCEVHCPDFAIVIAAPRSRHATGQAPAGETAASTAPVD